MRIVLHRPWLKDEGICGLEADSGASLLHAVWLSGKTEPVPVCNGQGRCGNCRVRYLAQAPAPCREEIERLGGDLIERGWRLACRRHVSDKTAPAGGGELHLELAKPHVRKKECQCPATAAAGGLEAGRRDRCVMAVDLGTTTIAWRMLRQEDGTETAGGEYLNPQAGAGADVVSRIGMALQPDGARLLQNLVRRSLAECLAEAGRETECMVVAANTAMTEILAGTSVHGLAGAPYTQSLHGHEVLSLEGLPPVYIPPLPAPFVGGDVAAGLAWLEKQQTRRPYVLADLGTNGEIALMTEEGRLFLTSVPLGPALEGIGLECGAQAGDDVLTSFALGPFGITGRTSSGEAASASQSVALAGISATGYLSLIEQLLNCGFLDAEGHFATKNSMPLAKRLAQNLDTSKAVPRFMVTETLWLSLLDIEEILKVKAAFSVALHSLLARAEIAPSSLASLNIAGAIGSHVLPGTLERTGFVPRGMGAKVQGAGNTSLKGACLLACNIHAREELARLCRDAVLLEPAQDESFHEQYISAMHFGWQPQQA